MSARKRNREAKKKEKAIKRQQWEATKRARQVNKPADAILTNTCAIPAVAGQAVLYHGTSGRRAEAMNTEGIIPRRDGECNWPDRPGRSDCVYLTSVWGLTYALHTLIHSAATHTNEEGYAPGQSRGTRPRWSGVIPRIAPTRLAALFFRCSH